MRFEGSHTLIEEGCCSFGEKCEHIRIYRYYLDVRGVIRKCFLGFSLRNPMESCDYRRLAFGNVRLYDVNGIDGHELWIVL